MDGEEDFRTMKMKCNLANAIKESRNNEGVGEREREKRSSRRSSTGQNIILQEGQYSTVQCSHSIR